MTTRSALLRRGLWLEYITLGSNVVGVVVVGWAAIAARSVGWAAIAARSVALAGFGLDSLIEIDVLTVVGWERTARCADRADYGQRHLCLS